MTQPDAVHLSTVFGRIVAALRQEQGLSQARLAARVTWDRSLLARIEAGRNTANIDNIFELEEVFIADRLLDRHGDLVHLCGQVVREAKRRGLRTLVGHDETAEGLAGSERGTLERLVARILDDWLVDAADEPSPPESDEPDPGSGWVGTRLGGSCR